MEVSLTPELQQFAEACVASGHYENVSAVAQAALRMLQGREQWKAELLASVLEAKAEGERDGFLTIEDMETQVRAALAEAPAE